MDVTPENCPTTTVCIVEKKRGFKPSDRHNPQKKQFLLDLSNQIWQKNQERTNNLSKKIDLVKIFTPATDAVEILPKHRKLYASSAFYSPVLHPTIEDQVEIARRISRSLSDVTNEKSKGQSMYVNRKKRSSKWVHEGYNKDFQQHPRQEQQVAVPNIELFAHKDKSTKGEIQSNILQKQLGIDNYLQPLLSFGMEKSTENVAFEKKSDIVEQQLQNLGLSQTSPVTSQCINIQSYPSVLSLQNSSDQKNSRCILQWPKTTSLSDYRKGLAYKTRIPQGWKSPITLLPQELALNSNSAPPLFSPLPSVNSSYTSEPYTTPSGGNTFQTSWKPVRLYNFHAPCANENVGSTQVQWPNQSKPSTKYSSSLLAHDKLAKFENVVASSFPPPCRTDEFVRSKNASRIVYNRGLSYTDF